MLKTIVGLIVGIIIGLFIFYLFNHSTVLDNFQENNQENEQFSYWKKFIPPSGKFAVFLPSVPQYAKDLVPVPNTDIKRIYEVFVSEKLDSTLFMVSMVTYPQKVPFDNPQEILKGMVQEILSAQHNGKLNSMDDTHHQSNFAYYFDIDNDKFKIQGKVFLVNQTLYVLSYVADQQKIDKNEYNYFIDSFKLLNHEKK